MVELVRLGFGCDLVLQSVMGGCNNGRVIL